MNTYIVTNNFGQKIIVSEDTLKNIDEPLQVEISDMLVPLSILRLINPNLTK